MSKRLDVHFEMLNEQVTSIFKYYDKAVINRWEMADYVTTLNDGVPLISYSVEHDKSTQSRRRLVITIAANKREFKFYQNYNFGVALDSGVEFVPHETSREQDLIDFEYALSIATEDVASQIAKRG